MATKKEHQKQKSGQKHKMKKRVAETQYKSATTSGGFFAEGYNKSIDRGGLLTLKATTKVPTEAVYFHWRLQQKHPSFLGCSVGSFKPVLLSKSSTGVDHSTQKGGTLSQFI